MECMGYLRRTGQAFVIALTALTTLAAGFPRLDCICPNGNIKQFCMGSATNSDCCCSGSCCDSADIVNPNVAPAVKSCCCQSANAGKNTGGDNKQQLSKNPCRKQFADSTPTSIA